MAVASGAATIRLLEGSDKTCAYHDKYRPDFLLGRARQSHIVMERVTFRRSASFG
jgi:hypothetical protein